MFKDPKIQLALAGFIGFFIVWCALAYLHVPETDSLMKFVQSATASTGMFLLAFIKTDGNYAESGGPSVPKIDTSSTQESASNLVSSGGQEISAATAIRVSQAVAQSAGQPPAQ